jgi:hypothetical protein
MVIDEPRLPGVLTPQVRQPDRISLPEGGQPCVSAGSDHYLAASKARPERGMRNARHLDLSPVRSPAKKALLRRPAQRHRASCRGVTGTPSRRMTPAGW